MTERLDDSPSAPERPEALHRAAEDGDLAEVQRLVAAGVPIDTDIEGWTPLMEAADRAHVEVCRFLLEHGANPRTGVQNAACSRTPQSAELLEVFLQHGCRAQELLHVVAGWSTPEALQKVIEAGVDLNARDDMGETALYCAAKSPEKLRLLLKSGADPTLLNADGLHVLHMCALWGFTRSVRCLLRCGVPPDLLEEDPPVTALFYACNSGRYHCARLLLRAGADPNLAHGQVATPLMAASRHGSLALVNLLLEAGANPRVTDPEGRTACDYARDYLPDALTAFRRQFGPGSKKRPILYRRRKNSAGEPTVIIRRGMSSVSWTDCHRSIVERLKPLCS